MTARTMHVPVAALLAIAMLVALVTGCSSTKSTAPPEPGPLSGVVRDSLGRPAAGIDVVAQSLRAIGGMIDTRSTVSGADGAFDFGLVARVDWLLGADGPGLAAADTVRAPSSSGSLVLRRAGVVRGRALVPGVVDQSGTLVLGDLPFEMAVTDSQGRYVLGGLPVGGWYISAMRPVTAYGSTRVTIAAPGDTDDAPDIVLAPVP